MNITFKAENGFCPYCIYGRTKFYIQDSRNYKGDWVYALYSVDLCEEVKEFETNEKAFEYLVNKKVKHVYSTCDRETSLYSDTLHYYILKDKTVTVRQTETPLTGKFDSYAECLKFAKEYVKNYIRERAEQMSIL